MSDISILLEQIADGIDPTTGEVIDTELLRGNADIILAILKLQKTYMTSGAKIKGGSYAFFEREYPNHAVIMKEGFFYSAHNKAAFVLSRELEYNMCNDSKGRPSTGGPDLDKIINTLKNSDYSFIVVEAGKVVYRYDGRYPFVGIPDITDTVDKRKADSSSVEKMTVSEREKKRGLRIIS